MPRIEIPTQSQHVLYIKDQVTGVNRIIIKEGIVQKMRNPFFIC